MTFDVLTLIIMDHGAHNIGERRKHLSDEHVTYFGRHVIFMQPDVKKLCRTVISGRGLWEWVISHTIY